MTGWLCGVLLLVLGADTHAQLSVDFTATATSGTNPLTVDFSGMATGGTPTTWLWNFGDGSFSSVGASASHTYTLPGTYTPSLTAVGPAGNDSEVKTDLIVVAPAVFDTEFTVFPVIGHDSTLFTFDNLTSGAVTGYLWDFGDGSTSTEHSPTHGYALPGEYEISLTASVGDQMKVISHGVRTIASFAPSTNITSSAFPYTGSSAADLDGDGDIDLVAGTVLGAAWFENQDGNGNFGSAQAIATPGVDLGLLWTADGDGDGDTDLFFVDQDSDMSGNDTSTLKLADNTDGLGSFGAGVSITSPGRAPVDLRFGDFDGDGDLDLLSAQYEAQRVGLHRQDTAGGFTTYTDYALESNLAGVSSVDAGDIDGDGDLDAVAASRTADSIGWYENVSSIPTFGPAHSITTTADGVWSTRLADLDGDGDLDLVSAGNGDDTVRWFENGDGSGGFLPGQTLTAAYANPSRLELTDLDADGDVDVAFTLGVMTAWMANTDGQGTFGAPTRIEDLANFHIVDLDGDGLQDLLLRQGGTTDVLDWSRNIQADWPWEDLGGASLGIAGAPALQALGPLTAGSLLSLDLEQAPAGALMLLRASLVSMPVNAIGGTLYTNPYVQQLLLAADPQGAFSISAPMTAGVPAGLDFTFQFIVQDFSSPHGITLSNAMVGTTP